ncbi:MAG TPA: hypothetical protein PLV68_12080, partial [Ilumatobacteraceae bacterium]|nr:hypothetical protein [Ilumatobacteraceae bacterium]
QMRKGVNEFMTAVENFNQSMATINQIAQRANALLDDVEAPIRAMLPQVTRSIKAADAVIDQITGPIERVAPGISRLADTLANPIFTSMPHDIAGFLDSFGEIAKRMQPLAQMAESAGSMFGFRNL